MLYSVSVISQRGQTMSSFNQPQVKPDLTNLHLLPLHAFQECPHLC